MQRKGLAVGLLTSLLGACASPTDPPADGNAPPPSCADRSEAYTDDHVFPFDPNADIRGLSQCVPRCGAVKPFLGEFYATDALPGGTCAPTEVACSMLAHHACPCPTNRGPVNSYQCSCNSGRWTCVIVSHGASTCFGAPGSPCPPEDAGRE